MSNHDNIFVSGNVNNLPVYSNESRPDASQYQSGYQIWNSDDNAPNISNGTSWLDVDGNLT